MASKLNQLVVMMIIMTRMMTSMTMTIMMMMMMITCAGDNDKWAEVGDRALVLTTVHPVHAYSASSASY